MYRALGIFVIMFLARVISAQDLPDLPLPIGAGTAEVWHNEIYFIGGSNNWAGSIQYPRIYRFDGMEWAYHDSIPDYNLWDVESVLVGDDIYLISGWPAGANLLRKYNINTGGWTYLESSTNLQTWGVTAEYFDGKIYLFDSLGNVYIYNITANEWSDGTANTATGTWDLSSIFYQGDIYLIGFDDSTFFKYSPSGNDWTELSKSPYHVGACAMGIIDNLIYCVGGNEGGGSPADYNSVIVYDINTNQWQIDSLRISKRHWMATAEYRGGLYILGGIDSTSTAVNFVEEIIPQGTSTNIGKNERYPTKYTLFQNYPNPFNPSTSIRVDMNVRDHVRLRVFNILGQHISTLVDQSLNPGTYIFHWPGQSENQQILPSGIYFYELQTKGLRQVKKMIYNR